MSTTTVELLRNTEVAQIQTRGRYRVNNALAIRESLTLSGGIGIFPDWLVRDLLDTGKLVRVLDGWTARSQDLHLLYPSRKYQPPRTKLFIEFAIKSLSSLTGAQHPIE